MPFDKRLRHDNDEGFPPMEEPGKQDHNGADAKRRTSRFDTALLKQGELPAKKQVFGNECVARRQQQTYELEHATFYKS
jgi:hypothetical protein